MRVWLGEGLWPFLLCLGVFLELCHLTLPAATQSIGEWTQGAHESPVCAGWWLCSLLDLTVCVLFAADHTWQGYNHPWPAAPGPPWWLLELVAPSLQQRGSF